MLRVAVVGATGYTGEELVKILLRHPGVKITSLSAKIEKEEKFSNIFPWAKKKISLVCKNLNTLEVSKVCDVVFLAVPHKASMAIAPKFLSKKKLVIDLSADYRLESTSLYKKWYNETHKDKANIIKAVYGLPEVYGRKIAKTALIANPGCYPTGAILGCAPLLAKNLVDPKQITIDAKSGVTGAGRNASLALHFCETNEDLKAYKVNQHQHMPEIEQELSKIAKTKVSITFVPHLVPMNRGILSTIYLSAKHKTKTARVIQVYKKFYKDQPFVRILDKDNLPQIKDVVGTNFCNIGIKADGKKIIVITTIDNLQKGAAGQAVQNMNIACGFNETAGLGISPKKA